MWSQSLGRIATPPESFAAEAGKRRRSQPPDKGRLAPLPLELAFLAQQGAPAAALAEAADAARCQGVTPDAALLAGGAVSDVFYYRALARRVGAPFVSGAVALDPRVRYPHAIEAGAARVAGPGAPRFIAAPRGAALSRLLHDGAARRPDFAIATPAHFARLVRRATAPEIAREASLAPSQRDPDLSARGGATDAQCIGVGAAFALAALASAVAPQAMAATLTIAAGLLFLAALCLRLFAAAVAHPFAPAAASVPDHLLPAYSVVIALHREARVVRQLSAALDAIDYPPAKLDIKLVIEQGDSETRNALFALDLPPRYEIIVAPPGWPRTKPRALNVALPAARGEFIAVYDAEDLPAARQLRDAAERFRRSPHRTACLQAQLCIDNMEDSWLTRMFAVEYAVLFDVLLHGFARLGLPLPLGGSSNHFRTAVLREIGGWDAWNVTEDADLGLRLVRFGYRCETLLSTTLEEAPARLDSWLQQRMRWSKGWTQTCITLSRDPARLVREVGWRGVAVLALMLTNLVLAPLAWPIVTSLLAWRFAAAGLPMPQTPLAVVEATLWLSVALFGAASMVWLALLGMKRRKLLRLWPALPLLPLYYLLMSAAAWAALYDLARRPFHWRKTEHGLARRPRVTAHRPPAPADPGGAPA